MLPPEIRAEVLCSPTLVAACLLPQRPLLHMKMLLARLEMDAHLPIYYCQERYSELYAFDGPRRH